jgi:hypothetical protein
VGITNIEAEPRPPRISATYTLEFAEASTNLMFATPSYAPGSNTVMLTKPPVLARRAGEAITKATGGETSGWE